MADAGGTPRAVRAGRVLIADAQPPRSLRSPPAAGQHGAPSDGRADTGRLVDGVIIRALGRADYEPTWRAMQSFTAARTAETRDEIWLTEHPAVYTLGLAGRRAHLLRDNGIPVVNVDRGGQVTYHGPGQLVAYLLYDLRRRKLGIRAMVRAIEAAVVEWLSSSGVCAYGKPSAPGVYVSVAGVEAKIAALGLRVRNGCTYHGLAVNVAMDLAPFADIDPCGCPGLAVTQLADLGLAKSVDDAGVELAPILVARLAAQS